VRCLLFFALHPTPSMDLWLVLKAGISQVIILQDTSEEALKSTEKKHNPTAGKEGLFKGVHLSLGFGVRDPNDMVC